MEQFRAGLPQVMESFDIRRDGTLTSLVSILNSKKELFLHWNNSEQDYLNFLQSIEPWVTSPPTHHLPLDREGNLKLFPVLRDINCSDWRLSDALTGVELETPRVMVDFIPFGYDIDLLEIRLYEEWNVIDVFVIYESEFTQSGLRKPLYFSKVANSTRFKHFEDKIIHLTSSYSSYTSLINEVLDSKRSRGRPSWKLEWAMRTEMVKKFIQLDPRLVKLKKLIIENEKTAWGLQNDGDEIFSGDSLNHLRHCEVKQHLTAVNGLSVLFKKNYHWIKATREVACISSPELNNITDELKVREFKFCCKIFNCLKKQKHNGRYTCGERVLLHCHFDTSSKLRIHIVI